MIINKVISTFLCVAFVTFTVRASAQDTITPFAEQNIGSIVTPLHKGDKAPFTGVELSPSAVAEIMATLSTADEETRIEVTKATTEAESQCKFKLSEQKASSDASYKVVSAELTQQQKTNKVLLETLKKEESSGSSTVILIGIGFVAGTLVSLGTVWAVGRLK